MATFQDFVSGSDGTGVINEIKNLWLGVSDNPRLLVSCVLSGTTPKNKKAHSSHILIDLADKTEIGKIPDFLNKTKGAVSKIILTSLPGIDWNGHVDNSMAFLKMELNFSNIEESRRVSAQNLSPLDDFLLECDIQTVRLRNEIIDALEDLLTGR